MADIKTLSGLRTLIVGLGREGVALATVLAKQGLAVTATDLRSEAQLSPEISQLKAAKVSLVLGEHPSSLLDQADILFVSPGVPLEAPLLQEAQARKIPLSTESRLFCHLCPAPVVGISGSSGKTTTTTLVGKILEADGQKTWVGGNIGRPLISVVDEIAAEDSVVMELSSFQLEYFHARLNRSVDVHRLPAENPQAVAALLEHWSPPVAAILNITPNHLDRHPTMKHYVRAKRALIDYQKEDDAVVLGLDNDMTRTLGHQLGARVRWFSLEAQLPNGAGLAGSSLAFFDEHLRPTVLANRQDVKLRGPHNLQNILAACLLAKTRGASLEAMRQVITTFTGVEHRLELVREHAAVSYFNDSISTSPERLVAAIQSFTEPIVLLAGGRDKHLPWDGAARLMLSNTRHTILFGEAADTIARAIEQARAEMPGAAAQIHRCQNLAAAVEQAAHLAQPGQVVLLSPGCASFDAFANFAERGQHFKKLVLEL